MGLPVNKLICASNENKVLFDFFSTGTYNRKRDFILTSSPSMDILISSNLERLIYKIAENDSEKNAELMAELAKDGVNVRFIELMPIGQGKEKHTLKEAEVKHILSETYGTIRPCVEKLGSGPAHYMEIDGFEGKIGFISAISHKFCSGCNRVRMTADGFLKPCLQYETGMDLRTLLRDGVSDAELKAQIEMTITQKPKCHHFGEINEPEQTDHRGMSEIGG